MIMLYLGRANWIAGILLIAAFVSTFWKHRSLNWLAAGFYSAGSLICIGAKVYLWLFSLWLAYSLSDSDSPNNAVLAALVLPISAAIYGIASVILLWPWISQKNAMCFGKILHLIVLPIFLAIIFASALFTFHGEASPDLQWLVYGPLWFRIRETLRIEK